MCGIAGTIVFGASDPVNPELLTRMRDTMTHHGPDGAGQWMSEDGRVGFGFRRLAIIDLSPTAMQPMSNEDRSLWVMLNGEIYNHAELRAELNELGGHQWTTDHSVPANRDFGRGSVIWKGTESWRTTAAPVRSRVA